MLQIEEGKITDGEVLRKKAKINPTGSYRARWSQDNGLAGILAVGTEQAVFRRRRGWKRRASG